MTESNTEEKETDIVDVSIDVTGVGKAMRAIPATAWQRIVDTACSTVEKTLAPITETAHGIGRLVQAKFDGLVDAQKVMAAEAVASATKKAKQSGQDIKTPRPQILIQVIEQSANETDSGIRELWSNLLAQEMLTQGVHPEIARVLSRISSEDAQLLVNITEDKPTKVSNLFAEAVRIALDATPIGVSIFLRGDTTTFNHAHLRNLGLIDKFDGKWALTVLGEGFIAAVTDPSISVNGGKNNV